MRSFYPKTLILIALSSALVAAPQAITTSGPAIPRTAGSKPDLQGIWQASTAANADLQDHAARNNMLAGRSVVVGGEIPYQPWAAAQKTANYKNRLQADPVAKCFM